MAQARSWVPGEVGEIILDHLHDDQPSLAVCSLVCRQWLHTARYHTFQHVHLDRPWQFDAFSRLAFAPLCTFLPFVRSLSIRCRIPPRQNTDVSEASETTDPSLHSSALLFARLTRLRNLYISDSWLETFTILVDILSVLPELESLELVRAVKVMGARIHGHIFDFQTLVARRRPSLALRTLKVDDWTKGHLLHWLAAQEEHQRIPTLTAIHLGSIVAAETEDIGRYVQAWGPTLEHLELGFSTQDLYSAVAAFHTNVDLTCATHLRTLRIAVHMPWADWFLILSDLASHDLEEVAIDVWFHPEDNRGSWDEMDLIFTLPQFANLRRIRIGPLFYRVLPRSTGWMRARLPLCDRRGILEFADESGGLGGLFGT